jgi:hypothetical protein
MQRSSYYVPDVPQTKLRKSRRGVASQDSELESNAKSLGQLNVTVRQEVQYRPVPTSSSHTNLQVETKVFALSSVTTDASQSGSLQSNLVGPCCAFQGTPKLNWAHGCALQKKRHLKKFPDILVLSFYSLRFTM